VLRSRALFPPFVVLVCYLCKMHNLKAVTRSILKFQASAGKRPSERDSYQLGQPYHHPPTSLGLMPMNPKPPCSMRMSLESLACPGKYDVSRLSLKPSQKPVSHHICRESSRLLEAHDQAFHCPLLVVARRLSSISYRDPDRDADDPPCHEQSGATWKVEDSLSRDSQVRGAAD